MHAIALILALVSSGAPGSSVRLGTGEHRPRTIGPFPISGGLLAGSACSQWPAPTGFRLLSMHFTENTAGVGTSMTYAVKVNGSAVCSLTVACDSSGRQDVECDDVVLADDDVEVAVVTDNCLVGNPSGNLVLIVQ